MWRLMPNDLKVAAGGAFWADEQAALEQAEAVALIARQIKFRPKSVLSLTHDKKARHLAGGGENLRQHLDAVARFLGAGFQEIEKLVVFAENLLQGNHSAVFGNRWARVGKCFVTES